MVAVVSAPAPASYRVQPGDTLSAITEEFYGNEADWPALAKANRQMKNPDVLHAGDLVKLPKTLGASTVTAAFTQPLPVHVPQHAAAPKPVFTPKAAPVYAPTHTAARAVPVPVGIPASGNMVGIAAYFEDHGFTRAASAGIAAAVWGESGGNPESVGSGGFGLIGWTGNTVGLPAGYYPDGDRARDMSIQLAGVVGYIDAEGGKNVLNDAGGPVSAAEVFSRVFERPAVLYSDIHYGGAGDPTAIYSAL
jgi:hypothetical protein